MPEPYFIPFRRWLRNQAISAIDDRRRRRLTWRLMEKTGVETIRFERDGLIWHSRINPYDDISWKLYVDGEYQTAELHALLAWARGGRILAGSRNVLIDAGANLGTTCIPFVRETGGRALAIEPVGENFRTLSRNVEANGLGDRILLAHNAVAMECGRLLMQLGETSGSHFLAGDEHAAPGVDTGVESVSAAPLCEIVATAGLDPREIALVWADVQGSEVAVIESGSELWKRGVPLWAEVEPHSLTLQGTREVFADAAAAHFNRFIDARDLMRTGISTVPRAIGELRAVMENLKPPRLNTDVLLLPPALRLDGVSRPSPAATATP